MSTDKIDLTSYLDSIGKIAGQCAGKPHEEIQRLLTPLILDLSGKISRTIAAKEKLEIPNDPPLLRQADFECYFWAMAIISSAFASWVYKAKSMNPDYMKGNYPAATNAKIAKRYVRASIVKAIALGRKAGCNEVTKFAPQGMSLILNLRRR
jgi:hypothetical protein